METYFKAYTRAVQGASYYFVKKYACFPEDSQIPDILEKLGMHTEFVRACSIAGLSDEHIMQQLLDELHHAEPTGRVIPFSLANGLHAIS